MKTVASTEITEKMFYTETGDTYKSSDLKMSFGKCFVNLVLNYLFIYLFRKQIAMTNVSEGMSHGVTGCRNQRTVTN